MFPLCFVLWRSGPARVAGSAVTLCWGCHGPRGIGSGAAVLCRMKTACIGASDTIERRTAGNAHQRKANRHEPERRTCNQRTNVPIIVRHCDSVGMSAQLSWLRSAYDPVARACPCRKPMWRVPKLLWGRLLPPITDHVNCHDDHGRKKQEADEAGGRWQGEKVHPPTLNRSGSFSSRPPARRRRCRHWRPSGDSHGTSPGMVIVSDAGKQPAQLHGRRQLAPLVKGSADKLGFRFADTEHRLKRERACAIRQARRASHQQSADAGTSFGNATK